MYTWGFEPHDAGQLAQGILEIVTDRGLRQSYIEKGLRRAHEFTWERTARETLEVLKELA